MRNRVLAVVAHLGLRDDPECFAEFKIGSHMASISPSLVSGKIKGAPKPRPEAD
jgi:hypothetical protein